MLFARQDTPSKPLTIEPSPVESYVEQKKMVTTLLI